MAAPVARLLRELSRSGFQVDLFTAKVQAFADPSISTDFTNYIASSLENLYLTPPINISPRSFRSRYSDPLRDHFNIIYSSLVSLNLESYRLLLVLGPFNSAFRLFTKFRCLRNLAVPVVTYFFDPVTSNPLDSSYFRLPNQILTETLAIKYSRLALSVSPAHCDYLRRTYPLYKPKIRHLSHTYDHCLYPSPSANPVSTSTVRFIGSMVESRNPCPFLDAILLFRKKYPDAYSSLAIEFYGHVDPHILTQIKQHPAFEKISIFPRVNYIKSLKLMASAHLLLLVDRAQEHSLFVPSKLADYLGSQRPILSMLPDGDASDTLKSLNIPVYYPSQLQQIADALFSLLSSLDPPQYIYHPDYINFSVSRPNGILATLASSGIL